MVDRQFCPRDPAQIEKLGSRVLLLLGQASARPFSAAPHELPLAFEEIQPLHPTCASRCGSAFGQPMATKKLQFRTAASRAATDKER
jgi:hypothetical protein